MTIPAAHFPQHFTPLERQRLELLIARLTDEPRLARVVAFGSRARGHSHVASDLDIAVYFSAPRNRGLERWLDDQGEVSSDDASAPRLQLVSIFSDEPPSRLAAALRREGIVLWTRN